MGHSPAQARRYIISSITRYFDRYTEAAKLEAKIEENAGWKVIAEEIVKKDGVYRAVNFLNKRITDLTAQLTKVRGGE